MKLLDIRLTFFEALKYPQYARPNFFVNRQKDSEWTKGVYLKSLYEIYHECIKRLRIHYDAKKRKANGIKLEDIKLPINEVTTGNAAGTYNKRVLEELRQAIQASERFGRHEKNYTSVETLSFVEYALGFIRNEFSAQSKGIKGEFARPGTSSYFTYLIVQDGPFFNFPKFKAAFRELVLSSNNLESLKQILKPFYTVSVEIVRLWNKKIHLLENVDRQTEEILPPEMVLIEFHSDETKKSWGTDLENFEVLGPRLFLNQDFAYFAAKIANLLSSELLGGKEVKLTLTTKNFITDFIDGIKTLLQEDTSVTFIDNLKNKESRLEAPFRNWFSSWFKARRYATSKEQLKGKGHIDLTIVHIDLSDKIIEFKGWWNPHKKQIIQQLYKYLTQFEGEGYIVMINDSKKPILNQYKKIVTGQETGYCKNTWKLLNHKPGDFQYYKSEHQLAQKRKRFITSSFQFINYNDCRTAKFIGLMKGEISILTSMTIQS